MNDPVSSQDGHAVVRNGVLLPPAGHDAVSLGAWAGLAVAGMLCWSVILSVI